MIRLTQPVHIKLAYVCLINDTSARPEHYYHYIMLFLSTAAHDHPPPRDACFPQLNHIITSMVFNSLTDAKAVNNAMIRLTQLTHNYQSSFCT